MSYEDLLIDQCDVYHLQNETAPARFGVPTASKLKYAEVPDADGVSCLFVEKGQSIVQGDPNNEIVQTFLVHFLIEEDVRLNDKVVWNGITAILQAPRNVRNHHWEVTAIRKGSL